MTGRAGAYARLLVRAVAAQLREATTTGRRWGRPPSGHPQWCARDHRCTAGRLSGGEHRSAPTTWWTPYGSLIATRTSTRSGRSGLELRADVRLAGDDELGRRQAQLLAVGVDLTVRAVLAEVSAGRPLPTADVRSVARTSPADVRTVRPARWPAELRPTTTTPDVRERTTR